MEERARRLLAGQQVQAVFQATGTFSPSVLPPPLTHTPFDLTFTCKSPVAPPPPCNTPCRSTPSVVVPTAYRQLLHRKLTMPSCLQALLTTVISPTLYLYAVTSGIVIRAFAFCSCQ